MLSLEEFRREIGYHPFHFWGMANSEVPVTSNCNSLVKEYDWQGTDQAGRETIRAAIRTAENRLREFLGFRVGLEYVEEELIYPRPYTTRHQLLRNVNSTGRLMSVNLREGHIHALGIEAFETLDASAAVVCSDSDGDGVTDLATITVNGVSAALDTAQVVAYFVDADRPDGSTGTSKRKWRIEPIEASLSDTTLTIRVRSWQLARPIIYAGVATSQIDPNATSAGAGNFAQTLQIYRAYTNPDGQTLETSQAVLLWEAEPPYWACNDTPTYSPDSVTDPAAVGMAVARCGIRNARIGEVMPGLAVYDSDTELWNGINWQSWTQPDRVKVRFLAGASLTEADSLIPDSGNWKAIIARLAAAELAKRICGCAEANRWLDEWQTDLARISGNADHLFRISERDLDNPFGTRRGHVYAWKQVRNLALTRAYSI